MHITFSFEPCFSTVWLLGVCVGVAGQSRAGQTRGSGFGCFTQSVRDLISVRRRVGGNWGKGKGCEEEPCLSICLGNMYKERRGSVLFIYQAAAANKARLWDEKKESEKKRFDRQEEVIPSSQLIEQNKTWCSHSPLYSWPAWHTVSKIAL